MKEWNEADFIQKTKQEFKEVVSELENNNSLRAECLILTNFIESVLKDIIEYHLQTKSARKIARETIREILHDLGIINDDLNDDIGRIFKIRDLYGHNLSLKEVTEQVEVIISNMKVTPELKATILLWDTYPANKKLGHIAIRISQELDTLFAVEVVKRSELTKSQ